MSAIFAHAMRWEFFDRNPITLVRQSTKRQRGPEVLTVEELKALFEELEGIYRTMVFVGGVVGLRVSEVIGLRWSDCDFESGEIHLSRGIVRQHETEMKTEASRKPVPMEQGLAEVLRSWRAECRNRKAPVRVGHATGAGNRPARAGAIERHRRRTGSLLRIVKT